MLREKKILLCVTGGIAIYKSLDLASMLVKVGAVVKTIMTKSAMELVTPLSFKSITHETVSYKMFDTDAPIHHISLSDWADLVVVAPATANTISKLACGIADDLLTTTILACKAPKLIVPAMNVNMWENPIFQDNLDKLKRYGFRVLEPEVGRLACGVVGKGRMPAPTEIMYAIRSVLLNKTNLNDKKILITAGATVEHIDPMRYITNVSSGKMGLSLARAAALCGADVTIVHGKVSETLPYYTHNIQALSAQDMYHEVMKISDDFDIIIMCAAVADYTPETPSSQKLKKHTNLTLNLIRTNDILAELGKKKKQILIGFAAESENLIKNARQKLINKNLDMIITNDIRNAGENDTEVVILKASDTVEIQVRGDKFEVAMRIFDEAGKL